MLLFMSLLVPILANEVTIVVNIDIYIQSEFAVSNNLVLLLK